VHGNSASLKQFFDGAMRILFKWLKRRGQRRSCNWTGFKEMLDHYKVEQPRIVGRPRACPELVEVTRRAASFAQAFMRKRVCLKSPVRLSAAGRRRPHAGFCAGVVRATGRPTAMAAT